MLGRETVKNVLANVGITPGKFRVSVDGQEKVYYMADDGEIYTEKERWIGLICITKIHG